MIVVTPGGFEGFFGAVEEAGPGCMKAVSAGYGIRFVGSGADAHTA